MASRERGIALLLASVLGAIAFAVWALSFRATMDGIRAERRIVDRSNRDPATRALAAGLALLRTGEPEVSPVSYLFTVDEDGESVVCTVTYTETKKSRWDVESRRATTYEESTLPAAPATFDS